MTADNTDSESLATTGFVLTQVVNFVANYRGHRARITQLFKDAELPIDQRIFEPLERQRDFLITLFRNLSEQARAHKIDVDGIDRVIVALRSNKPANDQTLDAALLELERLEQKLRDTPAPIVSKMRLQMDILDKFPPTKYRKAELPEEGLAAYRTLASMKNRKSEQWAVELANFQKTTGRDFQWLRNRD